MRDKLSINKNYLIFIAGFVWIVAGSMVMRIGVPLFLKLTPENKWLPFFAIIIFLVFYFFIFSKLVNKHVARIKINPSAKMPFWNFFDLSSYFVMLVMMSGGIFIRVEHLVPAKFIAFFYSGLGLGLFFCGIRFINSFFRKKVLLAEES